MFKFFCKHNFVLWRNLPCTFVLENKEKLNVPIDLLICEKCGKRKVLRSSNWFYSENLLKKVKLWEKGLFNFEQYAE